MVQSVGPEFKPKYRKKKKKKVDDRVKLIKDLSVGMK
jgi:hypothetical protein